VIAQGRCEEEARRENDGRAPCGPIRRAQALTGGEVRLPSHAKVSKNPSPPRHVHFCRARRQGIALGRGNWICVVAQILLREIYQDFTE
jgi:hypothetical protein